MSERYQQLLRQVKALKEQLDEDKLLYQKAASDGGEDVFDNLTILEKKFV